MSLHVLTVAPRAEVLTHLFWVAWVPNQWYTASNVADQLLQACLIPACDHYCSSRLGQQALAQSRADSARSPKYNIHCKQHTFRS
jgi:hypothetical protein